MEEDDRMKEAKNILITILLALTLTFFLFPLLVTAAEWCVEWWLKNLGVQL